MEFQLTKSLLRPLRITDASSISFHANNPKIAQNLRDVFPHPYTIKDAKNFIANYAVVTTDLILAIEIGGEAAGIVGIHPKTDVHRKNAEIGYWLGEKNWGKGIVTEAVNAVVNHAFAHFDIHRIYGKVFERNPASMRVLEKCGFIREAIHRKAICKQDIIMDEYVYARLR